MRLQSPEFSISQKGVGDLVSDSSGMRMDGWSMVFL